MSGARVACDIIRVSASTEKYLISPQCGGIEGIEGMRNDWR